MSSKEVKNMLKEAREAIKAKDFPAAIVKCKKILEQDENHYMALILMGAAYQESDKQQAASYLKLALKVADDQTIALQGLANCAESVELPSIYEKLLTLTPDKYRDLHQKLLNVSDKLDSVDPCLQIFEKETESEDLDRRTSSYECVSQIAIRVTELDDKWNKILLEALEKSADNELTPNHKDKSKALLRLLYKSMNIPRLVERACDVITHYPEDAHAYEWICKIYVDKIDDESFDIERHLQQPIMEYITKLMVVSRSAIPLLANAVYLVKEKNEFIESRNILIEVNSLRPDWYSCQKYSALVNVKLRANTLAELFARQSNTTLLLIRSLVQQNLNEKTVEVVEICRTLLPSVAPTDKTELLELYATALIRKKEFDTEIVEELRQRNSFQIDILWAMKHEVDGDVDKAIAHLNESDDHNLCDHHLLLGQWYFSSKKMELALTHFLKATRIEPYNSDCFFWLGKLYLTINDQIRAQKCFEKCVYLYPRHQQGVTLLSAMYRQSMNWDGNNLLLQSAANAIAGQQCKWARIQLGFHYLALKNFNDAIQAFRMALREDANDLSCWEGLADAYFQRGSYNSASKVYQKISEIDPLSLYPKLQVANIKTILKFHKEAVICFDDLLKEHPDFVPALSGMAEAHLGLCYYYLPQRLLGRCKSHAEEAVKYLIRALQLQNNFACLWRLLANALQVIACLPNSKAFLTVPGFLVNVTDEHVLLDGDKLFELSARVYYRAIKIRNSDDLLWYELGLSYYLRAIKHGDDTNRKKILDLAVEATKHAIKLSPARWKSWNLLGVICTTKEINKLPLAQHCFIKALNIDKKSAISWTNLGVLYLIHGQIKLANKAFGRSQQADTGYINAWTGQAYIAERIGEDDEAMDLFKHSTSLGYTAESAIGFTHWVCTVLNSKELLADQRFRYTIEKLHAVPIATDSIIWFCEAEDDKATPESLCFLGYLYYRQRLWRKAIESYRKAVAKSNGEMRDHIFCNLGYAHLKNNEPLEAYEAFHSVTSATLKSTVGLALAHFKAEQYEESYAVYDSALNWLAANDQDKAFILIAMAAMVYKFQGEADAKTLLFQCIGLDPPIEGLYSGCALAILHGDRQMTELILQEFKQYESNSSNVHHIALLTSQYYLKMGQTKKALVYLLSRVHIHPDNMKLRNVLANFLLLNYKKSPKYLIGASRIAQSTISLQLNANQSENSSLEAARSMAIASEAMEGVDKRLKSKLAQKAVHLNPACKEAWGALITSMD
ncbi:Tetratricopeptide repeat protein 37 [Pseudolycoriella hygida]|uniref:Tetratricopeptide repeat protein 37 n=1 Tax=Pseudolycoriella hygida TaxID=35572 RepID=A0A9Q0N162_9DIPT|nr:Tetratricopeptide repeat protein 37 [Pseudolycoriella hygida]